MPSNDSSDFIQADSFTMKGNPNSIAGVQASETFMVTAKGDTALAEGGLQVGFAKYQFDGAAFDKAQKDYDRLASAQSDCNRDINGFINAYQNTTNDLAAARESVAAANQKLDDHAAGTAVLSGDDLQSAQQELENAQKEVQRLEGDLSGANLETARETLKTAQEAVGAANKKLNDHADGTAVLSEDDLQSAQQELEKAQQELENAQQEVKRLEMGPAGKARKALDAVAKAQGKIPADYPELANAQFSQDDPAKQAADLQDFQSNLNQSALQVGAQVQAMEKVAGPASYLYEEGTPPPPDRSLLSRQVASYEVDKAIGIGVIAPEKFGVDADGKAIGISMQADGAGVTGLYQGKDSYLQVDLSDPNVQRGLYDLEAMDYITGQIDRHAGNMFIDPETGKVTGIDNDLAFPEKSRQQMLQEGADYASKVCAGPPKLMHRDTAEKILNTDPEDLRRQLKDMPRPDGVAPLSDKAIDGAVERLKELQAHLRNPKGPIKVVDEFNKKTYEAAIKEQSKDIGMKDLRQAGDEIYNKSANQAKQSYLGSAAMNIRRYENQGLSPRNETGIAQRNSDGLKQLADQNAGKIAQAQQDLQQDGEVLAKVKQGGLKGVAARMQHGSADSAKAKVDSTMETIKKLEKQSDRILAMADDKTAAEIAPQLGRKPPAPPAVQQDAQQPKMKVGAALQQQSGERPKVPSLDLSNVQQKPMVASLGPDMDDKGQAQLNKQKTREFLQGARKDKAETPAIETPDKQAADKPTTAKRKL
ncbi:MAG TPA: hypothetical protein DIT13_15055 [Verrucomicrobiales bacterium]|nr:hypothetical protein [Verrucomicrobiales bacterium]HRJ09997.1 hypothetical protein [Prosthecobacter sp.]HRK16357.1 hypothetical protein [Prosthecobacter sp.]